MNTCEECNLYCIRITPIRKHPVAMLYWWGKGKNLQVLNMCMSPDNFLVGRPTIYNCYISNLFYYL